MEPTEKMTKFSYLSQALEVSSIELSRYPSGEPLVKHGVSAAPVCLMLQTTSVADLMTAMFWVDACRERGLMPDRAPPLVLPFFPGARQDRVNPGGDFLFTAKSVAREVNARGFSTVVVADPHSEVVPALLDRCVVAHSDEFINPPEGKYSAVISPDAGAEKRAARVAKKLGVPLLHAWKERDVRTGALCGFGVEPLAGLRDNARVLIVDDICDGGGTFVGLSEAISAQREQTGVGRLKRDLFTTFGLYTQGPARLLEKFDHVYCTDLVGPPSAAAYPQDAPHPIVIPVASKMLLDFKRQPRLVTPGARP